MWPIWGDRGKRRKGHGPGVRNVIPRPPLHETGASIGPRIAVGGIYSRALSATYDNTWSPYGPQPTGTAYKEVRLQNDDFLGCSRRSLLR